jgi:GNAT superfamily N-acetyltransferase
MLEFKTALNQNQLIARHELLQSCLRPENTYPIELEYPHVFSLEDSSISGLIDHTPIVHANILYREFGDAKGQTWKAALVGNVATHEAFRGQGLQKQMFTYLEKEAYRNQGDILMLWSDLDNFYEKLGFCQFGKEVRYQWTSLEASKNSLLSVEQVDPLELSTSDLQSLLSLRPPGVLAIKRSAEEFRQLLKIPEMGLFVGFGLGRAIQSWGLTGKGCDMRGVFHEWGAASPDALFTLLSHINRSLGGSGFMTLAPFHMEPAWHHALEKGSASKSVHPMALVKQLSERNLPESAFVWGLDSI